MKSFSLKCVKIHVVTVEEPNGGNKIVPCGKKSKVAPYYCESADTNYC